MRLKLVSLDKATTAEESMVNREKEHWYDPILEFCERFGEGHFAVLVFILILAGIAVGGIKGCTPDSPEETRASAFKQCMLAVGNIPPEVCERVVNGAENAKSNHSRP